MAWKRRKLKEWTSRYLLLHHFKTKWRWSIYYNITALVHNHSEEKLDENKQENSTKAKSNKASSKHRKQSEQEPPRIIVDTEFFVANNEPRQSRERQLDNNFDSDSESEIESMFPTR